MAVDYVAVLFLRDSKTHHHHNEHDKLCTSDNTDNLMCKFIK